MRGLRQTPTRVALLSSVFIVGMATTGCGGTGTSSTTRPIKGGAPVQIGGMDDGGPTPTASGSGPTTTRPTTTTIAASRPTSTTTVAPTTAAIPTTTTPNVGAVYASLGDSYSSGEGNPPYDPGTDLPGVNRCHNSAKAWPRLLGVTAATHLACSGAVTDDIAGQLARLVTLRPAPSTVFLTIGGNDLGFASVLAGCFTHAPGAPCWSESAYKAARLRLVSTVAPKLESTYRAVKAALPGARVIVASYPSLFAADGTNVGCPAVDAASQARIVAAGKDLAAEIGKRAKAAGVEFVDLYRAYPGHELCTAESWVGAVDIVNAITGAAAHPTVKGNAAMAAVVTKYLRRG